jgi:plastocyanin
MIGRRGRTFAALAALGLAACGDPGREARRIEVHMSDDNKFAPIEVAAAVGDTIEFVNDGIVPHTATDTPGPDVVEDHNFLPSGAQPWDSGVIDGHKRFAIILTTAGVYHYRCGFHEAAGMLGTVTVAATSP